VGLFHVEVGVFHSLGGDLLVYLDHECEDWGLNIA